MPCYKLESFMTGDDTLCLFKVNAALISWFSWFKHKIVLNSTWFCVSLYGFSNSGILLFRNGDESYLLWLYLGGDFSNIRDGLFLWEFLGLISLNKSICLN